VALQGTQYLFFLIKAFPLSRVRNEEVANEKEMAISIYDLSEKILLDSQKEERKYLT